MLKSNLEVPLNKEQVCAKARDAHKASAFVVGCVQEMVSTSLLVFVPGEVYGVAACYPNAFYLLGVFCERFACDVAMTTARVCLSVV